METAGKRKGAPNDRNGGPASKKKKGGNEGKWKTPHQQGKSGSSRFGVIEPGFVGVWATCARHQEGRSARELRILFDEYAEKLYGINTQEGTVQGADEDDDDLDIEAAIQKELGSLKATPGKSADQIFTEIRTKEDCLLFMKVKPPVEPAAFVKYICENIKASADGRTRKTRYLNRLTPVTVMGKATMSGVEDTARQVLSDHFVMKPTEEQSEPGETGSKQGQEAVPEYSYAIRTSTRNHNLLNRDDVIHRIANLVDPRHKVNLKSPDKVILVDIYQTVCGMSVVDGNWDELKKYNLTEIYNQAAKEKLPAEEGATTAAEEKA